MAANRDKDDIAAALHGLSAGHHDSAADHADAGLDQESPAPAAPTPIVPPQPRPTPPARPATPVARPGTPAPIPAPVMPPPARLPAVSSPPASSSNRVRPTSPLRPAAPVAHAAPVEAGVEQVDGDEQIVFGADPDTSISATPSRGRPVRTPTFKTLGFRQTAIPVLLTLGVMMIGMAVARWVVDEEAPLARLPGWVGALLIASGVLMLLLGVANMLAVRAQLASRVA